MLIVYVSEKVMAPHSSTLAWKIPWTEEPGRLRSMGISKSWTQLSDFTFTFHFHALEKEMATHSSVLAWRIPGTGEPGGLRSLGSHRVGHDWSGLAAAASSISFPCIFTCLQFAAPNATVWKQRCQFSAFRMSGFAPSQICRQWITQGF